MSSSLYEKMLKDYTRGGKTPNTMFMQEHKLAREGEKFETRYFLQFIGDGDGFEVKEDEFRPLTESQFGISEIDIEGRANAVKMMVGDEFLPLSASWLE